MLMLDMPGSTNPVSPVRPLPPPVRGPKSGGAWTRLTPVAGSLWGCRIPVFPGTVGWEQTMGFKMPGNVMLNANNPGCYYSRISVSD
jgi:hypothetical protein